MLVIVKGGSGAPMARTRAHRWCFKDEDAAGGVI
jgi:hypothetical protein